MNLHDGCFSQYWSSSVDSGTDVVVKACNSGGGWGGKSGWRFYCEMS